MAQKRKQPSRNRPIRPIGFIGLGLMGTAMVKRLIAAGNTVIGWDIAPESRAAFTRLGGLAARNAADVFGRCECVLLSLPDSKVVATVLQEAKSSLRYGQVVADTSTGDPGDAVRFSRRLALRGVRYLDATISGNSDQVRRAEVLLMAGGPRSAFARCEKIFRTFAARAIHTGPAGSGAQMKLVTNLVLGLNRAALAEGLAFARALGLNGRRALAMLRASMAYSRIMDVKGERMLRGNFQPQARLSQHLKDVRLMLNAARIVRMKLPLSETHRRILERAEAAGLGQLDNSAIIRVLEAPDVKSARLNRPTRLRPAGVRRSRR